MRQYGLKIGILIVLLFLISNCRTLGLMDTARTTPPKKVECGTQVRFLGYTHRYGYSSFGLDFNPEMFIKYGLSEHMDLGLLWSLSAGGSLIVKYQFLRGKIDGAFSIMGTYFYLDGDSPPDRSFIVYPRIILSNEKPHAFPFVFHAGLSYDIFVSKTTETALAVVLGGGVPFFIKQRSIRLQPDISVVIPIKKNHFFSELVELPYFEDSDIGISIGINLSFLNREN